MTLDDALGAYDWLPDGWVLASAEFDCGTKTGVGVWNGKHGAECRRHAVMLLDGEEPEDAFPTLLKWIEQG